MAVLDPSCRGLTVCHGSVYSQELLVSRKRGGILRNGLHILGTPRRTLVQKMPAAIAAFRDQPAPFFSLRVGRCFSEIQSLSHVGFCRRR